MEDKANKSLNFDYPYVDAEMYSLGLFSVSVLESFLKEKKIRKRNLVTLLDKEPSLLKEFMEEGILLPIPKISMYSYRIFLETDKALSIDEHIWDKIYTHTKLPLTVGDENEFWISTLVMLEPFATKDFNIQEETIGYNILSGPECFEMFLCKARRFKIERGKYELSISGLIKKEAKQKLLDKKQLFSYDNVAFHIKMNKVNVFENPQLSMDLKWNSWDE